MKIPKLDKKTQTVPEWLYSIILSLWCFVFLVFGLLPTFGVLFTSYQLVRMDEIKFNKYKNEAGAAMFNYTPDRKAETLDKWKQNNKRSILYNFKVSLVGMSISVIGFIFLSKMKNEIDLTGRLGNILSNELEAPEQLKSTVEPTNVGKNRLVNLRKSRKKRKKKK